uniref:Protein spire n=1 Tax=Cacopsylla melanoneura TaxID=428564 RepID=A0A8D8ZV56_9HEMI
MVLTVANNITPMTANLNEKTALPDIEHGSDGYWNPDKLSVVSYETVMSPVINDDSPPKQKKIIKVDFSALEMEDDDYTDSEDDGSEFPSQGGSVKTPWHRTAYDLATQCPSRRASMRRHTIVGALESSQKATLSVPQSRSSSRNSRQEEQQPSSRLGNTLPEMSWSRTSLQDDLLQSHHHSPPFHVSPQKQWQEDCLSLTLEEIVHIRSVLTKAELESLPVEGHVKEDAEKRRVCFLCMKTRFSLFGPWGQVCRLCKRTVCSKCHSKMRIPTEHFAHVPVVALSPSLLSPDNDPSPSLAASLFSRLSPQPPPRASVGSAPSSPKLGRTATSIDPMSASYHEAYRPEPANQPMSLPFGIINNKRSRFSKSKTLGRPKEKAEKLKGLQMIVCNDCKIMVLQIIKSSRCSRTQVLRSLTLDISPVY